MSGINSNYVKYIKILQDATNIAIFMHINPDCDCISSAIALSCFLKKTGKKASFFSPDLKTTDMISAKYKFLPFFENFNKKEDEKFDLAISVDTGDCGRLGDTAFKFFKKIPKRIVIDHHEIHEDFCTNTLRESDSASTTQILYKLMSQYDEKLIDKEIASLLFAGLVTDSGGFTFDNCSEETFWVASKLKAFGINSSYICDVLLKNIQPNVFLLKNKVLSKAKFYENGTIGIIVFKEEDFKETNTSETETDGIINNIRDVSGVEIAISIAQTDLKKFKISFRTKYKVNAASCAKCFGGGGHIRAAGCRIFGYIDDVYEQVLSVAREMLNND